MSCQQTLIDAGIVIHHACACGRGAHAGCGHVGCLYYCEHTHLMVFDCAQAQNRHPDLPAPLLHNQPEHRGGACHAMHDHLCTHMCQDIVNFVEFFAGQAEVTQVFWRAGLKAMAFDIDLTDVMDMCSPWGMASFPFRTCMRIHVQMPCLTKAICDGHLADGHLWAFTFSSSLSRPYAFARACICFWCSHLPAAPRFIVGMDITVHNAENF